MEIKVAHGTTPKAALEALGTALGDQDFDFITIHTNCTVGQADLAFDEAPRALHGATSCLGAMTHEGVQDGAAVFALKDPEGDYGTAMVPFTDDVRTAAAQATKKPMARQTVWASNPTWSWIAPRPQARRRKCGSQALNRSLGQMLHRAWRQRGG